MTIAPNVPFADYARIRAVNWSTLKHLRESPLHYRHALEVPSSSTPAMQLGTAAHMAILEPARFASEVAVWDGGVRRGKAYEVWEALNQGKLQLREQDLDLVEGMARSVRSHAVAAAWLEDGQAEVVVRWTDATTGLACKCRLDWLDTRAGRVRIVDLKTAVSTHPRRFAAQAAKLGYHSQLAMQRQGVAVALDLDPAQIEVAIVAVENTGPHDVGVYLLDDDVLYPGDEEVRELLDRLRTCLDRDEWPGRTPDLQRLELPAWVFPDDEAGAADLGLSIDAASHAALE